MTFDAIGIAGTGLTLHRKWLDAVSDNLANINTVRPTSDPAFQERFVVAQAVGYGQGNAGPGNSGGVAVTGVSFGDAVGRLQYDPTNPMADGQGMVRAPNIDLGDQMTQLMMAQRAYQANLAVVERAKDAYQAALGLGK